MYLTLRIRKKLIFLIGCCLFIIGFGYYYLDQEVVPTWSSDMNYKIVIDAGHGSIDSGASSGSMLEKDINLSIARKLYQELKKVNIYPIMTRTEDELFDNSRTRDIRHRVELTRDSGADIFLSIHVNKFPSSQPAGSQVFYKPGCLLSKSLADYLRIELIKLRKANDRVIKNGDFYVLNGAPCPAVLIEVGFISNPEDRKYLADPDYHQKLARAIKDGMINYLQSRFGKRKEEPPDNISELSPEKATEKTVNGNPNSITYLDLENKQILYNNRKIELPADYQESNIKINEIMALYALKELAQPPEGLISPLPVGTKVRSLKIVNGVVVVDFSKEIRENFQGGGGTERYLIETITRTLFSIPGVQGIEILIAGERGATIGGHIYLKQFWKNESTS